MAGLVSPQLQITCWTLPGWSRWKYEEDQTTTSAQTLRASVISGRRCLSVSFGVAAPYHKGNACALATLLVWGPEKTPLRKDALYGP